MLRCFAALKSSFQQTALHQDSTEPFAISVPAEPIILNLAHDSNNSNDGGFFKIGLPNFPVTLPALTLPVQPMSAAKSPVLPNSLWRQTCGGDRPMFEAERRWLRWARTCYDHIAVT